MKWVIPYQITQRVAGQPLRWKEIPNIRSAFQIVLKLLHSLYFAERAFWSNFIHSWYGMQSFETLWQWLYPAELKNCNEIKCILCTFPPTRLWKLEKILTKWHPLWELLIQTVFKIKHFISSVFPVIYDALGQVYAVAIFVMVSRYFF